MEIETKRLREVMDYLLELVTKLVRLLKPKHNQWVARILLTSGLGMLSQPWWIPFLNVVFEKSFDASLGVGLTGWIILGLGLGIHFLNRREENAEPSNSEAPSKEKVQDHKTLVNVLESIHSPTFDEFIDYGRGSYVLMRIFHFWEGFRYLVEGSDFYIYDSELRRLVSNLYDSWDRSLSFGEYFTDTNNTSLHRFKNRWEMFDCEGYDDAHDQFVNAIFESDAAYRNLLAFTRNNYPDIDIDETNEISWSEYVAFMAK